MAKTKVKKVTETKLKKGIKVTKKKKVIKKSSAKEKYVLRLYMVGQTPNCVTALNNLRKICSESKSKYSIEIIDLLQLPELAKDDQILAVPTVIRKSPKPTLKVIGDLSNTEDVKTILGIKS